MTYLFKDIVLCHLLKQEQRLSQVWQHLQLRCLLSVNRDASLLQPYSIFPLPLSQLLSNHLACKNWTKKTASFQTQY